MTILTEKTFEKIKVYLENKEYNQLRHILENQYPMDIAEMFDDLSPENCVILFRLLAKDKAAEVFSYLSAQSQKDIVSSMDVGLLKYILDELYFDDKIDFLEEMPANFVTKLLNSAPIEERSLINQFLNFSEHSAGSLMTIEYVGLKQHMTVQQALERIRQIGVDKETIYTCYVLDDTRHLEGLISLRRLVLSDGDAIIRDIMHTHVVLAKATDDREDVADQFKKYDLIAIPVVDSENRLIGIITIDDIVDVIEKENTEDFQKMAAMIPADDEYLHTAIFTLAKRRIIWLLILMISATFTGMIISHFQSLLSVAVILTSFIPMLMDSGGNAGSQSATLIIRGIALGEITLSDWSKVFWKEFRVSIIVGIILTGVNLIRMLIIGGSTWEVMATVSITLFLTINIAKIIGGLLPLFAKSLKLDPAIMASPMITTIVDAISLIIFFMIASALIL